MDTIDRLVPFASVGVVQELYVIVVLLDRDAVGEVVSGVTVISESRLDVVGRAVTRV